jgi:hypothetical protein
MAGAKYRVVQLEGETQYYNVLLPKKDLEVLKSTAASMNVTTAEVLRIAVRQFIEAGVLF